MLSKSIVIALLNLPVLALAHDVRLAGHCSYSISVRGGTMYTTAFAEKVANYDYTYATNPLKIILVLSPSRYVESPTAVLKGPTIAGRVLAPLAPRTQYANVKFKGTKSKISGRRYVVMAILDNSTRLLYYGFTFKKTVNFRSLRSYLKRELQTTKFSISSPVPAAGRYVEE